MFDMFIPLEAFLNKNIVKSNITIDRIDNKISHIMDSIHFTLRCAARSVQEPAGGCDAADTASLARGPYGPPLNPPASIIVVPGVMQTSHPS